MGLFLKSNLSFALIFVLVWERGWGEGVKFYAHRIY